MTSISPEAGVVSLADVAKLDQINLDGTNQLNNPAEIRLRQFAGTGLSTALSFSSDRMAQLIQHFVQAAEAKGLIVSSAGADYPAHATISDGKYPKPQDKEQVSLEIIEAVKGDSDMEDVESLLTNLQLSFDRIVVAPGGAIIFAATAYPNAIRQARAKMDLLYRSHGLETKAGDDILFSTAVRLSPTNTSINPEQGQAYLGLARDLQKEVEGDPVKVITLSPYIGPSAGLIPNQKPIYINLNR